MRKLAAAALAVPVIALLYVALLLRQSVTRRIVAALGVGAVIGFGVIGLNGPAGTTAAAPHKIVPVTSAEFRTDLRLGQAPNAPIAIAFSTPMNTQSVAESLRVEPNSAVDLRWNATGTSLTVVPIPGWQVGAIYTITVEPGALAGTGRPLSHPVRAAFLVRQATVPTIAATRLIGARARLDSDFRLSFDHPVDADGLRTAIVVEPSVPVTLLPAPDAAAGLAYIIHPLADLRTNTVYRVALRPDVRDADGGVIAPGKALAIRTIAAPSVIRFSPRDSTTNVDRGSDVLVRFTRSMDRISTRAAFRVTVGGTPVAGSVTFSDHDRVLDFNPRAAFGYGQAVVVSVAASATSADGVPLSRATTGSFITYKKPPARKPTVHASTPIRTGSGSAVGSGSWGAVESYYLRLMNCTRTGGWVTSTGACSSPGGRNVAPLRLDAGISSKVSRPYAKYLAVHAQCNHFIGGSPADRLRRAGYSSYIWAENLGCRSGDPYAAVLGSHLFFQSEKSYGGGHYVNLMNAKYDRAGIGVWVYSGRVRLVVDFYHPL